MARSYMIELMKQAFLNDPLSHRRGWVPSQAFYSNIGCRGEVRGPGPRQPGLSDDRAFQVHIRLELRLQHQAPVGAIHYAGRIREVFRQRFELAVQDCGCVFA